MNNQSRMTKHGILCRRGCEEFNHVAVGVAKEYLPCAVRTFLSWQVLRAGLPKMLLPGIQIIDLQREVVAPIVRMDRFAPFTNDVQFLALAQTKPCSRETEGRAGDGLEVQNVPVKGSTGSDVLHMDRHVVELMDLHGGYFGQDRSIRAMFTGYSETISDSLPRRLQ